jgi:hypothetical protein
VLLLAVLALGAALAVSPAIAAPGSSTPASSTPASPAPQEEPAPAPPERPEPPGEVTPGESAQQEPAEDPQEESLEEPLEEPAEEPDGESMEAPGEAASEGITDDEEDDLRERRRRARRQRVDKDTQVHFLSDLEIEENEVAREAVVLIGSLHVNGKVLGDAVSIIGPTYIDGEVTGNVTAVLDSVYLGPEAEVLGDVVSVGGRVEREPGARVLGEVSEVDFGPALHFSDVPWDWDEGWSFWSGGPFGLAWGAFWIVFRWVVLILVCTLVFLVARPTVEKTAAAAASEPWKAGLLGLATWLLFFPLMVVVTIVLALSIIGIPLLIIVWPLGLFALLIACLLGYTSVAYAVGGWLGRRFGWSISPWVALLIGIVAIQSLSLVARLFGSLGGLFWFFAVMFGLAGWLIRFAAWTAGVGAAILVIAEGRRAGSLPPETQPTAPGATGSPLPALEPGPPPSPDPGASRPEGVGGDRGPGSG